MHTSVCFSIGISSPSALSFPRFVALSESTRKCYLDDRDGAERVGLVGSCAPASGRWSLQTHISLRDAEFSSTNMGNTSSSCALGSASKSFHTNCSSSSSVAPPSPSPMPTGHRHDRASSSHHSRAKAPKWYSHLMGRFCKFDSIVVSKLVHQYQRTKLKRQYCSQAARDVSLSS